MPVMTVMTGHDIVGTVDNSTFAKLSTMETKHQSGGQLPHLDMSRFHLYDVVMTGPDRS